MQVENAEEKLVYNALVYFVLFVILFEIERCFLTLYFYFGFKS